MPHTARHGGSDDNDDGGSDPGSVTRDRGGAGAGGGGEPTVGVGEEPPAPDDSGGGLQSGDEILGDATDVGGGSSGGGSSGGSSGGGGGGGGGGSTTSPTRTVSGSTTLGANATTVSTEITETQATAPDLGESVPSAAGAVSEFGAGVREFQRETTPVQDAGRQTRGFLSNQTGIDIASEQQAADRTNEIIGSQLGTSPREARLGLRRGALDTIGSGVDTAVDAVPGDERGVAAGATALAVAEPTPFGEAALLGGSALAGVGGSTLTDPEQGSQPVPRSPVVESEIDAPTEPAEDQPAEVDAPDRPQGSRSEIDQPTDPDPGVGEVDQPMDPEPGVDSELGVDTTGEQESDAGIRASGQLLEREEQLDEDEGDDDLGPDIDPFDRSDRRLFDQRREFGDDIGGMADDRPAVDPDSAESRQDIGSGIAEGGEPEVRGSDAESFSSRGFGDVSGTELDPTPTDTFGRDFRGRERQVIGRDTDTPDLVSDDITGLGTDPASGAPTEVGAGSPAPPLVGATDPDMDVAPDAADATGIDDIAAPEVGDGTTDTGTPGGTITGTTQGIGVGERPDTDGDTDTGTDTDSGSDTTTRARNRPQTSLVEASATIEAAEATPSDLGDLELNAQPREPAQAAPAIANPTSGRPRRPRRPRAPETDREPQEPDVETLVTEGDTVTNPTRSLSAVDEDLQEVFDSGPP
jgi:hypothetical protein